MRKYETVFVLSPEISEDQVNSTVDKVKSIIEKSNGKIENVDFWGKKKLAYEINKNKEGYYIVYDFEAKPSLIAELERNYRITDEVMKFIVVKK